jgi:hypothetical protein
VNIPFSFTRLCDLFFSSLSDIHYRHREAARSLQMYICGAADLEFDPPFWQEGEVESGRIALLELGSGTGIVTSAVAEYLSGTQCMLFATDLPEVCPLLEKNLAKHTLRSRIGAAAPLVCVRPLAWGDEQHALKIARELSDQSPPFGNSAEGCYLTHIICSDVVRLSLSICQRGHNTPRPTHCMLHPILPLLLHCVVSLHRPMCFFPAQFSPHGRTQ